MKKQIEDWLLELSHNEVIPENIVALNFSIFVIVRSILFDYQCII